MPFIPHNLHSCPNVKRFLQGLVRVFDGVGQAPWVVDLLLVQGRLHLPLELELHMFAPQSFSMDCVMITSATCLDVVLLEFSLVGFYVLSFLFYITCRADGDRWVTTNG